MGFTIHEKRQLAEQIAREQLNKSGQYRFGIPLNVLNAKANEFMRLSDKELQKMFNEYFQSSGLNEKPKDLWDSMGLNLEQKKKAESFTKNLQKQINKKYIQPTNPKTKNAHSKQTTQALPDDVKKETRQFLIAFLKQAYGQKAEEFRSYLLNNKANFAEGAMELHDLGAKVADGLTELGIVIDRSDTRAEIREKLIQKQAEIEVLEDSINDEKAFNELFKKYFNQNFDYQTTFDYICASSEFSTKDAAKKIEKFNKNFENLTKENLKSADDYMGNANGAGGLLDLGFNVALMYVSGGTSAIAKYAQMTAKGGSELAENAIVKVAGKNFAQSNAGQAISQSAGIVAAQTTSAGLNAVAFQGTKTAELVGESIATGDVNTDKVKNIVDSTEGLFKFGYIGGAISGPLGMQVKNLTTKMLNSKPVINHILTKGITNKPTPLTSVLKDLSEYSDAVGEVLKFGTEFSINAGYMAYDDNVSYTDAMANLAQMDGVSKMVLAMLGAKNMSFLTPEKVQKIKTDLAGYKVNIAVKGNKKVYSIKDAQGKETVLATPEELFMFILDKEAKAAGIESEARKASENESETKNDATTKDIAQKAQAETVIKDTAQKVNTDKMDYTSTEVKQAELSSKETVGAPENISGVDSVLKQLQATGVNQECINNFANSIKDGSINLDICKDLFDTVKNDKELLESVFGTIMFCDLKPEDIPAKIEAYKFAKAQNMDVDTQTGLIMEANSTISPQEAYADIQLQKAYFEMEKSTDFREKRLALYAIPALKECAKKNGSQFVLDNFDLLKRKYYVIEEINPQSIEKLKTFDEYQTKMNISYPDETIKNILSTPKESYSAFWSNIEDFNKAIVESEKAVNNNKLVPTQDFVNVLLTKLSGSEMDREDFAEKIVTYFEKDGKVPSNVIKLIDLVKENYKVSSPSEDIDMILSLAFDNENGPVGENKIAEAIEFVDYLKSNNKLKSYTELECAMRTAKDENGAFDTKGVKKLYEQGFDANQLVSQQNYYRYYSLDTSDASYAAYVEIAGQHLSKPAQKLLESAIIKGYDSTKIIERLNEFRANTKKMCDFYEMLVEDRYVNDISSPFPTSISDIQIKAYKLLPKSDNVRQNYTLKVLSAINENNFDIYEKVMDTYKQNNFADTNFIALANILKNTETKEAQDILIKAFDNKQFHTKKGFNEIQMSQFLDAYKKNPAIAKEWVNRKVDLSKQSITDFDKFINGEGNDTPLPPEKRDFIYKLMQYTDLQHTNSCRTDFLELTPENGELALEFAKNNNINERTISLINHYAENNPEALTKLKQAIKSNPNVAKYFSVDTYCKYPDKSNLLLQHEDLLKSFGSNNKLADIFPVVDYNTLKEGMSTLNGIPNEVKTKYKAALAQIYSVAIANKVGFIQLKPEAMSEIYKKAVNYDNEVATTLLDTVGNNVANLKHVELSNLDFIADYIASSQKPDSNYIIKVLSLNENIDKKVASLEDILNNKDKTLKQVEMRCKDTAPDFVNFVKEYLNSKEAQELVFMPNLSMNSLANNLFEVSKIIQYVNTKPQDYINGHYDEKIINALKDYRKNNSERTLFNNLSTNDRATVVKINKTINKNIDNNFTQILDAISSTDIETVKLLLDKRFSIFQAKIEEINNLDCTAKAILSDVIRNGKRINKNGQPDKLTGQQKIDMINLISCATSSIENFNINNYKTPLKKGAFILDNEKLHDDILKAIFSTNGLSAEEINNLKSENTNWNTKYLSLLSRTPARDEGELADVVKSASSGKFNEFINDVNNKYGQTNLKTKQAFEKNGVNYEQWLKPDIKDVEFEVAGKQCHIKMWDRNPQEDMFLGSKTSCCTALDRTNGGSMATYMLNTSYNVVELYNAKGEVVGMSRVFMSKVGDKPTLIMDNIELNKEFIKDMDFNKEIKEIRDNFFKYMNAYAEKITGNPKSQVLFYSQDIHVPNNDLNQVKTPIDFLGNIHREEVYINAVDCTYHNPAKLKDVGDITWLEVPREE